MNALASRCWLQAAVNERQVIIALTGGELIYFELDMPGNLIEVEKKDLGIDVACLDIGPIPEGRQRSTADGRQHGRRRPA